VVVGYFRGGGIGVGVMDKESSGMVVTWVAVSCMVMNFFMMRWVSV
jgi:hypothetical protein